MKERALELNEGERRVSRAPHGTLKEFKERLRVAANRLGVRPIRYGRERRARPEPLLPEG